MTQRDRPDRAPYVQQVLDLYRSARQNTARCRNADRRLAEKLHQRGVPLEIVGAAFILALARRRSPSPDAQPLPPIASLHYFLPIIDELLRCPPDPAYIDYLTARLRLTTASANPATIEHHD